MNSSDNITESADIWSDSEEEYEFNVHKSSQGNQKKRKLAAIMVVVNQNELEKLPYTVENRAPNKKRDRDNVVDKIMNIMIDEPARFQKMYRLHPDDFTLLLHKIAPRLTTKSNNSTAIDPIIKLAVTLRFLAGGLHHDLAFGYELPESCIHSYIWETMEAIDEEVKNIEFPIKNTDKLKELEREFSQISRGAFRGTVAAGDGVVFRMEKPNASEVGDNVKDYFTRKGYYAFGMQAFADAHCKFLSISFRLSPSSHDDVGEYFGAH